MANGDDLRARLSDLLREPRETLEIEIKGWLDLSQNADKAILAKAAIALANHGGGFIILGFDETEIGTVPAEPRPASLARYSVDDVNNAIRRFAEPDFHCDVRNVTSANSGLEHPIVIVPGDHLAPIRSRKAGPNGQGIQANVFYIRRPGPASEAPQSGQEWDALIRRCVANAKGGLLDDFRKIMAGGPPAQATQTSLEELTAWFDGSVARWQEVVGGLTADHAARFPHGWYSIAFLLPDVEEIPAGPEMMNALRHGVIHHTGWPMFSVPGRPEIEPYPIDDGIECWRARNGQEDEPAFLDFWRVSPRAEFFLIRGYQEDSARDRNIAPGSIFDLTIPSLRTGEALLYAASMARQMEAMDTRVVLRAEWRGLAGRRLANFSNSNRTLFDDHIARQDSFRYSLEIGANEIEDALPELVGKIANPLYGLFGFFKPPATMITEELARMRRNRF